MFVATDNDRNSGAFISMVTLIEILRKKYKIDFFVILPYNGNGIELLEAKNIPYKIIYSFSWVIPISVKDSIINKIKMIVKKSINIKAIYEISKFIRDNDIDIVHINTTYSYVAAKAAIKHNIPLVWHLREFLEQHQNNTLWNRESGNQLINKADKIIVISNSLKNKYVNVFDEDKLITIYDSVDDVKFYKPQKDIFNNSPLIFIIVGRLEYPKGQIDFAKACSKLFNTGFKNFEAWFVGDGYDIVKNEIIDIFESSNMNNYKFLGFKENVDELYELADISFNCSEFEAFGRTTVESMLSGNLVIGADSGCTTELLSNENGFLYELHNDQDLFEKIKYAVENSDVSKNRAISGRKYAFESLNSDKKADEIFDVYQNILTK